jgi:hypothetical protein
VAAFFGFSGDTRSLAAVFERPKEVPAPEEEAVEAEFEARPELATDPVGASIEKSEKFTASEKFISAH